MPGDIEVIERDCVISGGGPAGMFLGYLMGRAGVKVTVLEKHADFLRDFRGDTIHPSTLDLLTELGLRDRFLQLPLNRVGKFDIVLDQQRITVADFGTLRKPNNFLVLAPQWDLLNFLASEATALPDFELRMSTEVTGLIIENERVSGVRATGPNGPVEVRATLTVSADGRNSPSRDAAGFEPVSDGVPIDVLWFELPKPSPEPPETLAYLSARGMVLTINRGTHYQAGMVIGKGGFDDLRAEGLEALRCRITSVAPVLGSVVGALTLWSQIKVLSVQLNRLTQWCRPGYIAIGDAAHAMSPMFGVGVNYAIQDAVALANAITPDLVRGVASLDRLTAVQRRRQKPVTMMQAIQRRGHVGIAQQVSGKTMFPPGAVTAIRFAAPALRPLVARFVGRGFRPEHVHSEERKPT